MHYSSTSFFSSLFLYDNGDWGRELLERYGPEAHAHRANLQLNPPRGYIPPSSWWFDLAQNILAKVSEEAWNFTYSQLRSTEENYLRGDQEHGYSGRFFIPNSLPTTLPFEHAKVILFAAIIIQITKHGIDLPID